MKRQDGRRRDQLRPISFTTDFIEYPEGSVLISTGKTKVLCNVSIEEDVPGWMERNEVSGGWVTAEYAMLPRSTHTRRSRETDGLGGRTQEIRRLIGRSLRAAVDLKKLGPRTCIVDCDVLQADGGTRTASITGGYVALALALQRLIREGSLTPDVFAPPVAAVSVGVIRDEPVLDLCYEEDSKADVDLNVVMNANQRYIEIQGTAEGNPFSQRTLDSLLELANQGIEELISVQRRALNIST
ncbi:MAG: ribonuclease PH [Anaerolineales bacterium]|nr:ribonuclease PH [Anaerolineales bacterium]MBS3751986.1 ribonuclease PH [Anaerolineales bacterium]